MESATSSRSIWSPATWSSSLDATSIRDAITCRAPSRARLRRASGRATMNELIDRRTRIWAIVAIVAGIALLLAVEVWDDPDKSFFGLLRELVALVPVVLTSAGVV